MYAVFFLRNGQHIKGRRGATQIVVRDAETDQMLGAVEKHFRCPHWYQQAPMDKIQRGTNYDTPELALAALGVDVEL